MASFYLILTPWLSGLAIIAYPLSFSLIIFRRQLTFLFVVNTTIIGAIITRLLMLAFQR